MNIVQIEENVKQLIHKIAQDELKKQDFIYELLLAYGHRSQSIGRVRNGERNLAEDKENTVFWKRQIYFKIAKQHDLHGLIDQMKNEKRTESNKIRFLIVTDFKTLLAVDTKTQDTLDVPFGDLAKKFDFFLPWAGMEKAVYQGENPADVKAAEKLAKLFDEIKADNFNEDDLNNKENLHHLNIFLSRLLFCYFAEDTEIFKDKQFTSAISKSNEDGSDLSALIGRLFKVLNQSSEDREADLPDYLADFPYVNGGLFKDDIQVPKFTRKSRRILIECGAELDWSDINPDIFGSMFQAVVHTEQRSTMGQHYTSVPNIMKVIEPLFLNDLYEELEKNQDSINKLLKLQQRLGQLKIFDPACGSGNFLIIAYKELRKFEMELLKRIQELELEKTGQLSKPFSVIQVSQFYGIEIDDFAHEIAILSLWLAEHQMNIMFKDEFGAFLPSLPLKQAGQIIQGNSLAKNWINVCGDDGEIYILGNPPYLGARLQTTAQKNDVKSLFGSLKGSNNLDYISCWFKKGVEMISASKAKLAFVTTNSITQGEQVSVLWPKLLQNSIEISFAYTSFKWSNNARSNAGVTVAIIGMASSENIKNKYLISDEVIETVDHINPYLINLPNIFIEKKSKPISNIPKMSFGSMANDGGNLFLTNEEKTLIQEQIPQAMKYIKKVLGSVEFIRGIDRYCIWTDQLGYEELNKIPFFNTRFESVKQHRLSSDREATQELANTPYAFAENRYRYSSAIIMPRVSSERREYIPIGFLGEENIISDSALAIYDAEPWLFSILTSRMHMQWVKIVGGRLKTDYRYSASIVYNTFPVPKIDAQMKEKLTLTAINILAIRENYSHLTLADLYDPDLMPNDLKEAHEENDIQVEKLYKASPFKSNEDRLRILFLNYIKMTK
ncbi:class I SAM-dependent DNA methyltransferase [Acinetobacter defluvii]|uniref:site-specific DNA-methyltransferase (adenine-specific) n=1 Tax=Acinetobacter defluvii TaxID=1871111 RepID=A0A2S2FA63_9GAMM|nr:DNA methyltransferase [Acinetobacter defluvii]AWL27685.1 class I SAM-dependent DNA methyltransferase [Acinetobacter defluvii]